MDKIIPFIISPKFEGIFLHLKIAFIVIDFILFISIAILLLKTAWLQKRALEGLTEFVTYRPFGVKKTFKEWLKITKRLESGKEAEYKLAVIEADNLLNEIFKKMGFSGETMSEKLKQITLATVANLEEIKEAHKTRNNIVYDPDYRLTLEQVKKIMGIYEKALRDLEVF